MIMQCAGTASAPGTCARCDDLFYQTEGYPEGYYDDPVTFVTPAASNELRSRPQAKPLATTASTNGFRYYTVTYRNNYAGQPTNGGQCGGGWGAHKCMSEIELYES